MAEKENAIYIEETINKEDRAKWIKIVIVKDGNEFFTKYTKKLHPSLIYSLRKRYKIEKDEVFIGRGKNKTSYYKTEK